MNSLKDAQVEIELSIVKAPVIVYNIKFQFLSRKRLNTYQDFLDFLLTISQKSISKPRWDSDTEWASAKKLTKKVSLYKLYSSFEPLISDT